MVGADEDGMERLGECGTLMVIVSARQLTTAWATPLSAFSSRSGQVHAPTVASALGQDFARYRLVVSPERFDSGDLLMKNAGVYYAALIPILDAVRD